LHLRYFTKIAIHEKARAVACEPGYASLYEELSSMGAIRNLIGGILFGIALCVSSTMGSAAEKDVALTQDNVSRFLESFAEMRLIVIAEGLKTGADSEAAKNPIGTVLKAIKSSKLQAEAKAIAVNHGFADLKDWTGTGRAIGHAYLFITTGPTNGVAKAALDKHKDAAIDQLAKLGILGDKQKQALRDNLDQVSEQLSRKPPPENVAIVQQMKPDIEAAVKLGVN
jgi:hypothetical protein